jgi:hypothetical protein
LYELTKRLHCGKELPVKLDYSRFDNQTTDDAKLTSDATEDSDVKFHSKNI